MCAGRSNSNAARCLSVGAIAIGLFIRLTTPVDAWWGQGHAHITVGATAHLPQPLGGFFGLYAEALGDRSAEEPPGRHYIDIDYYPEFFAGTFPHDVDDLIDLYNEDIVEENGRGPWTYEGYVELLTQAMASARTNDDWLQLLYIAGAQAHYIEDLHNPLHLTMNYNGQQSDNNGIHARYEGQMIMRHINDLTFAPASVSYLSSVIDSVFDGIDVHYYFVDDILAADDLAWAGAGDFNETYYSILWNQTGTFTHTLFQRASEAVANGWYTAWVNAGSPTPNLGLDGDYNGDNVIDAGDYAAWRNAMSTPLAVLMNDPTPSGVSLADYQYWKSHYGDSIGNGPGAAATAPEPETTSLAAVLAVLVGVMRLTRRGTTLPPFDQRAHNR